MRSLAALYDIHANLPALEAVLAEIRREGVDLFLIGGDVLPGPMPRESLALLQSLDVPVQFIMGNGDREVLARMRGSDMSTVPEQGRAAIAWTAEQLHPDDEQPIAAWPATLTLRIDGLGDVLCCHATPRNDTEIFTRLTSEERLRPIFENPNAPIVICGHTHMQFDRMIGNTRVVNAGSVGMPFGRTGADWLLLAPDIELHHTDYDLQAAAGRIRQTSYPDADDFVSRYVLTTPSEDAMLSAFSRAELR